MVLWWKNHREYGIEHNRGIRNETSNSHDAAIQYGSELYNLARTFDMASRLQILFFILHILLFVLV